MKRIKVLQIKLFVTGFHAFILLIPVALLSMGLDKLADFCRWASDKADSVCAKGGEILLPQWWPTHRILKSLNHERAKLRKKQVDKLHK